MSIPSKLAIKVHIEAAQYTKRMSQPCSRTTISYWQDGAVSFCVYVWGVVRNISFITVTVQILRSSGGQVNKIVNIHFLQGISHLTYYSKVPNIRVSRQNKHVGSK